MVGPLFLLELPVVWLSLSTLPVTVSRLRHPYLRTVVTAVPRNRVLFLGREGQAARLAAMPGTLQHELSTACACEILVFSSRRFC